MLITPAQPVRADRLLPWASFRVQKSLGDAKQKADKRGTQHWKCSVPALQTWMESASTNSDLISEASSLAGLDIRDVDLDSVNVGAISQVVEVSVHQGPVEAMSAMIEADQARTMDNLVSVPQCATLLMFAHASHLAPLLALSTSAAAPWLCSFLGPVSRQEFEHQSACFPAHL